MLSCGVIELSMQEPSPKLHLAAAISARSHPRLGCPGALPAARGWDTPLPGSAVHLLILRRGYIRDRDKFLERWEKLLQKVPREGEEEGDLGKLSQLPTSGSESLAILCCLLLRHWSV